MVLERRHMTFVTASEICECQQDVLSARGVTVHLWSIFIYVDKIVFMV